MNCPVCGTEAENISPRDFDGLVVRCRKCRDFEVAGTVLNNLLQMDIAERTAALEKAKRVAAAGARPVINSLSLG